VGTTFLLFTRKNGSIINHAETLNVEDAQIITSGSKQSLLESDFDLRRPVKIIIHGYKGSGKDKGALAGVDAFLNLVRNSPNTENDTYYCVLCLSQQNTVDLHILEQPFHNCCGSRGETYRPSQKHKSLSHSDVVF
jgi:hypothetical protein